MTEPRKPKKSDMLEVRLAHDVKDALMRKARSEGRSASEVVRKSIDSYLTQPRKKESPTMITLWKPAAALSVGLLTVIWGASTPAPLHAQPNIEAVFHALDRDANKAVSLDELVNHPSNPAVKQLHGSIGGGVHARMAAMHGHGTGSNHDHPATQELRAHFAKMDANSDGSLTIEEFRAFHDKLLAMHAGH